MVAILSLKHFQGTHNRVTFTLASVIKRQLAWLAVGDLK